MKSKTRVSGGLVNAGGAPGLDDLRRFFQPKPFHDSAILEPPEQHRSPDRRQHKSDFCLCDTLCFPHNNPHPVPPLSNNSPWCFSSARAHNKLPWHGVPVFVLVRDRFCPGEGVPGAAAVAPLGTGVSTIHHTQHNRQIHLSLKTLPGSQNCCRQQDSSDPNKLEQKENGHIITKTAK